MIDVKAQAKSIAQKHELWGKIKRLGTIYGEPAESLQEYAKDVYNANLDDLEGAIRCFDDLIKQAETLRIGKHGKDTRK